MEISEIEQRILDLYGIDKQTLYGNNRGREPQRVTEVRYIFMYILHNDFRMTGSMLMEMFDRCPRMIWKALSLAEFRIHHYGESRTIYESLREPHSS